MIASELKRSAPRSHASGSYCLATVKRSGGKFKPEENWEDAGANPIIPNEITIASESSPTVMGRAGISPIPLRRPVADLPVADQAAGQHHGAPDTAADRPSCRGSREK